LQGLAVSGCSALVGKVMDKAFYVAYPDVLIPSAFAPGPVQATDCQAGPQRPDAHSGERHV